jgi:hypothetical protein
LVNGLLEISQEALRAKGKSMSVEPRADETDVNKDAAISIASVSGAGMALWKQEALSFRSGVCQLR